MESIRDIMKSYAEKTDGAFIVEKDAMIVFDYHDVEPEFGNWQANELSSHIEHLFGQLPIHVQQAKKSLEVIPKELKKVNL